jgi:hypothetical protein
MAEPSPDTVFTKTPKGIEEIKSRAVKLPRDAGLVFLSIDGRASVAELLPRSGMTAPRFYETLEMLVADGYVEPATAGPASFTDTGDGTRARDPLWAPKVESSRASSILPQAADAQTNIAPDIDTTARARELKARVEVERRAREEAERQSRHGPRFDLSIAPEGVAYPSPQAAPAHDLRDSTDANTDAARGHSRQPGVAPHAGAASTKAADGFRATVEAHAGAAVGGIANPVPAAGPKDGNTARAAELRIEGDDPVREKLNVDRTAYDVLAEAAQARRASESALRAPVHAEYAQPQHIAGPRRAKRRMRFGIALLMLVVAAPVLAVLWLQFLPLTPYIPQAEQTLSAHLNQPVRLRSLRYVLLPSPRLVLEGVAIGPGWGVRVDRIEAHASPLALLDQPKHFRTIEVKDAVVAPAMLATLPSWLGSRGTSQLRIDNLQISNLRIDLPGAEVAGFDGDVSFHANGSLEQAVLTNDNLKIRLAPGTQGAILKLDATAWTIPFGPPVKFSYFTASGRVTERELAIDEFVGRMAGGFLQANGALRWPGPLVVHGGFTLQNVRLEELLPAFTPHVSAKGVLEATGRYEMHGDTPEALVAGTRLDADFRVVRGELENLDLLRGFLAPGSQASRGGRTPFEKLTGAFHLSPAGYQYRQVRLSSGPFNAGGTFEIARNGKLSGRLSAELVVGTHLAARSAFEIGGTVSEPVLKR